MGGNWIKGTEKEFPETFSGIENEGDDLSPEQVERARRLNKRQNFGSTGKSKKHYYLAPKRTTTTDAPRNAEREGPRQQNTRNATREKSREAWETQKPE